MKARILASHVAHALKGPPAPELQQMDLVRQACDWVSGMHAWKFLERPLRLDTRAALTISGAAYTHSTRTLTKSGAFATYEPVAGDRVEPRSGVGTTRKIVLFKSKLSDTQVVLAGDGLGLAANGSTDISVRFPNDSVALPFDFLAFSGADPMYGTDSLVRGLHLVSHAILTQRRTVNVDLDGSWSTVGAYTQLIDEATGESMPVLEVHPASTTARLNAWQGYYRARVVIDGDLDTGVVRVPADRPLFEMLLCRAVRAISLGYEEGDEEDAQRTMDTRLDQLVRSSLFASAKKQDGLAQPTVGPLRGGVGRYGSRRGRETMVGSVGFGDGGTDDGTPPAPPTPTTFSYNPGEAMVELGATIVPMAPIVVGSAPSSWSISPPLPAGLSIDPATGIISGTPT